MDCDQFECFGIPPGVCIEAPEASDATQDAIAAPGSGRRDWVLREIALLGAEALPSVVFDPEAFRLPA